MKSREIFEKLRKQKKGKFNLRVQWTMFVSAEIVVIILGAVGLNELLERVFADFWRFPLVVELLVCGLLIGIFVTSALARLFFDPIKKLGAAMEKVSDGDFSVRLETKSSLKEIKEIYSGFNLMVEELNAIEILQTDFASNVSHEFKTPINAIEGYAMLLQGCEELDETQREYVDKIVFNTKRLSSLTGSILLLSRLENQSIPTNQSEFFVDEQIRQSIVDLEPAWEKKDIEFDVDMDNAVYYGNEKLMRHVWDNIIGNAIKFNPVGGLVVVRLRKLNEKIAVTVDDNGPGISDEAKKRIFDKFFQADSSHQEEGNGLGLALVKKILTLEGGEIFVENIDGGCRFTVILKAKQQLSTKQKQ